VIYKAIIGSPSYGLNIGSSDVDAVIVSDSWRTMFVWESGHDMFCFSPNEFVRRSQIALGNRCDYLQYIFPHEFCMNNDLSNWIQTNREDMIKAQLPDVYKLFAATSAKYVRHIYDPYFPDAKRRKEGRKKVMYAIHFRNILFNYAEGTTFAEAHKAQGETREFLLAVRKGEVPIKLVLEENAKARERAKSVAGFYAEPKPDKSILDEFKYMVNREVELLDKERMI